MIDVKIFNVTVLMTNCCLLTDRTTGKINMQENDGGIVRHSK